MIKRSCARNPILSVSSSSMCRPIQNEQNPKSKEPSTGFHFWTVPLNSSSNASLASVRRGRLNHRGSLRFSGVANGTLVGVFFVPGGSIYDPWLHHLRGSRSRQKMAGDPRPIVDSLMDVDGTAVAPIAILYNPNHSSKTITLRGFPGAISTSMLPIPLEKHLQQMVFGSQQRHQHQPH